MSERKLRYTPLRFKLLDRAKKRGHLSMLDKDEEDCAFEMSRQGYLYAAAYGSASYYINEKGEEALERFRIKAIENEDI